MNSPFKFGFALILSTFSLASGAHAAVQTKTVEYKQGNTTLEGLIAWDDSLPGKRPGVLVIHDWKGVGSYSKRRAEQLAELGYVAFAADIYGKGIRPKDNKEAGAQAGIYRKDRKLLRERARAGLEALSKSEFVDANQLAAIGYCFGGGAALELARSGAPVLGTVSFHGNLDTPEIADAKNIKGKVLVLHGADDPNVPTQQVLAFEDEMRKAQVDWSLVAYGNAVHSFSNPGAGNDPKTGNAYNAAADRRSWDSMKNLFAEIFSQTKTQTK